jgi:putative ABC transport system permease protein
MNFLNQACAVAIINLSTFPRRLAAAAVVIAGIAGVVGVLVTVLALGNDLQQTFAATGRADRAIVTAKGAVAESGSAIQHDAAYAVAASPAIARTASGKPILSMEMLTQIRSLDSGGHTARNVSLRGIGPLAMVLRPEIHITQGRMFRPGLHEVIVGAALQTQFPSMQIGQTVTIQNSRWKIVGRFTAGGAHDSEILGDAVTLLSAFHRDNFQSITVRLAGPGALKILTDALAANPSLSVDVRREDKFFAEQSRVIVRMLTTVAYCIGGIMALGAVFAALNTMYAAVAAQALTIATLRAIGFGAGPVLAAVFAEALALAGFGALAGAAIAWLLFSGHTLSMLSGGGGQAIFQLRITPHLVALGVAWALAIGLLGGLFPAIRAARLSVAVALRPA